MISFIVKVTYTALIKEAQEGPVKNKKGPYGFYEKSKKGFNYPKAMVQNLSKNTTLCILTELTILCGGEGFHFYSLIYDVYLMVLLLVRPILLVRAEAPLVKRSTLD